MGNLTIGRVRIPQEHNGQLLVMDEAKRYNFLCAGRRWRKSSLLTSLGVEAALEGKSVLCGAPTYKQVRVLWGYAKKAVGRVAKFNATRLSSDYPNGGSIDYHSLDNPDNVRGLSADLVLLDEAPLLKPEVWHEALLPMLVDSGGEAWLVGTPAGKNWYYNEHRLKGEDRMSWTIPTVGCKIVDDQLTKVSNKYANPHIPYTEMVKYYEQVTQATFRSEILAEFIDDGGTVFRVIPTGAEWEDQRQGSWEYVVGVDLAKFHDWTVFSVINATHKRQCHIERMNKVDYNFQLDRLCLLLVGLYLKIKFYFQLQIHNLHLNRTIVYSMM